MGDDLSDADKLHALRQAQRTLAMARRQARILDHKVDVLRRVVDALIVDIESSSAKIDDTMYGIPPVVDDENGLT